MHLRRIEHALAVMAVALLVGCGGPGISPVSGRVVSTDGSPLKGAIRVIRFEPTEDSTAAVKQAASSDIAEDGSFDLYMKKPGDGVYHGKYAVTLTVVESFTAQKGLIPQKYSRKSETPFTIEVSGPKSDCLFEVEKL